jgi:hypothetical protein
MILWNLIGGCSHWFLSRIFLPWRWRRYFPPNHRFTRDLYGATCQKTAFFIVTAVITSNMTWYCHFFLVLAFRTRVLNLFAPFSDTVCDKLRCSTGVMELPLRVMCKAWRVCALDVNKIIRMQKWSPICYIIPPEISSLQSAQSWTKEVVKLAREKHRNTNGPWPTCGSLHRLISREPQTGVRNTPRNISTLSKIIWGYVTRWIDNFMDKNFPCVQWDIRVWWC